MRSVPGRYKNHRNGGCDSVNPVSYTHLDVYKRQEQTRLQEPEGLTPRAQNILEKSETQAERFRSERIGTEHILLAILHEGDSVATRLLTTLGVNIPKLFMEVILAMGLDPNAYKDEFQRGAKEATATPCLLYTSEI